MSFTDAYETLVNFDIKNESQRKRDKTTSEKKTNEKKEAMKKDPEKQEETRKRPRSKSPKPKVAPKKEVINYDIPSRQYGDLYCTVCDSHMNSDQMWESHIKGKRHIKSKKLKKADAAENKYEYCDVEPTIQKELEQSDLPIAGLNQLCEILSEDKPPSYQCFICSASLTTSKLVMEHITGLKHQIAFLKIADQNSYDTVQASNLQKAYLGPIVDEVIKTYAAKHGRGKMSVKKLKGSSSSKKKSWVDGDHQHSSSKSSRYSPPPQTSRYSPRSPSHSPPRSRYSPSKSSRYSPPPKSSRYSPPPKSARYSPPPKSSRYSPPPKSARMKGRNSEDEWKKVSPVRERVRERRYSDRSLYPEEENWAKIETEPPCYRQAPDPDFDTRYERTNNYSRAWSPDTGRDCSDLRAVLEQKKSLSMTRVNGDSQVSSGINDVPDSVLRLINDMSPEVFLSLALFKLNNMQVQDEMELKLLDSVANTATALALDIKKKLPAPDLKAKYKETLAQNGIACQSNSMVDTSAQNNLEFTQQNLDKLIGHYKARKATTYDDVPSQDSYSSRLMTTEQYADNRSSQHQLNSSQYRNSQERASSFDSGWNQRSSTSLSFEGFSSTPTYIPGLTLTEEPPAQPSTSTVLNQFAQTAKNIFGNINVPSTPPTPYQNEDYNRLNYRY